MRIPKIKLLTLLLLPMAAFAQEQIKISGTIKSNEDQLPLSGVELYVDGTNYEAITDEEGNFEIEVPENSILTVSYDGFEIQQLPVNNTISILGINLQPISIDNKQLDEVVVIGYGTAKKSDLTGSVGVIDATKLTERSMTNPMEAMQGNVPGVQITTSTGRIGDGFDVIIRGNNSMNKDSKPLFVVDGVPTTDIDFLNPQDISRIDVLKDASSTAIYGSRGSNGVIIVTTKSGSTAKNRFTISYDTYYGVKDVARLPKMMSGEKWWNYHQSAYLATAKPNINDVTPEVLRNAVLGTKNTELLRRVNANETFDWYDAVLQTGVTQNNYVSMSGRAENGMGYNIGIGAQKEKGNLKNEALDKYNVNLGVDHKINEKFSTGMNLSFALTEQQDGSDIAMQEAFRLNPFLNPYKYQSTELTALPGKLQDHNGAYIIDKTSTYNPLLEIQNTSDEKRRWNGIGNFFFEYRPVNWLSLKTTYSANYDATRRGQSWGAFTSVGATNQGMASAAMQKTEMFNSTWDNQINANFNINKIHQFNILALQSLYSSRTETSLLSSRNIPFETGYYNIGSGNQGTFNVGSAFIKQTLSSFALRMNYSLMDKYLLTLSVRTDGSSLLGEDNKWDYFPSAAVAWRISQEDFLKSSTTVSDLKLRASWGYTGNNIIDPYSTQNLLTQQVFYDYNNGISNGWLPGSLANAALTWEKTREFNIGLDFGLFKNRITGSVDVYDKLSDDLLMPQQLPYETGWSYINGNVGSVSNKGIEASLTAKIIKTDNVSWETTFTFSKNVNKIVSIYGQKEVDDIGNNLFIGESINSYYNYVFDGVWQDNQTAEAASFGQKVGQAKVKDINGDGKITTADRVILGSSDPEWSGSIFTTLKVGQFDFSASLITNQGVLAYSPFHENFTNVYDRGRSKLDMDYFVPTNNAGIQANASNNAPQSNNEGTYWKDSKVGYYRDASFVKVKNIALGYTFKKETLNKIGLFNSLRVYANVINPFVFTDYDGYDPEWATASLGVGRVSSITYQLGLSVKFLKKIMKKIFILLVALSTAYSCSDYLEEENLSSVSAEQYYTTAEGYTSLVNANYVQLKNIYGKDPWLFVAGTDLYAKGRFPEPNGLSQYADLNPSSEGVDHLYKTCYSAIQTANMAMHYADKTAQTATLPQQIAEIQYLRANAYFLLVQTYGGVSLVTDYFTTSQLKFERNTAEEIYTFVIAELEQSLAKIGTSAYNGHVNKKAVQHLLAQVYLTRGYENFGNSTDFTKAAEYADAAIGGQTLTLSFENLWTPGNEINPETIFSVQYSSASASTDPMNLGHAQGSYFGPYQGGSEAAGKAPYRTYSLCPTQFALDLYTEDDTRWKATFMTEVYDRYFDYFQVSDRSSLVVKHYYEPKWHANDAAHKAQYMASHPGVEYHVYGNYSAESNPNFDYQTIPVKKFDDPTASFGKNTNTRDIILSRLADTYLIAAEAYYKAGNSTVGLQRLNEVRRRAGVAPATASQFDIDYILDERAREMLGEYNRWFDLKRTGKLVERASRHNFLISEGNFVGNGGNLKILRPIPQSAIDLNQNQNFTQNPAY